MSFYATALLLLSAASAITVKICTRGKPPSREPPEDKARRLLQDIKKARTQSELDKFTRQANLLINSTPRFEHHSKLLRSQIKQQTCRLKLKSTAN